MTEFKPGDRVRETFYDRRSGTVVGYAPSEVMIVRFDGADDVERYHRTNLERIDPMDDSPEPSPHRVAREIIREEILYRLKGAESHARACASDHGLTYLASQADKAADVLTARLANFTDVLEPAGRPSREDVAGAIWTAENLDRAVLTDCWEIAGRVLDLYPEAEADEREGERMLARLDELASTTEPAEDLPVIESLTYLADDTIVEVRARWIVTGGGLGTALPGSAYHLVSAPEPDPDAELVEQVAKRLHDGSSCEDPYGVCVSSSEHFRSQARDLIALVRQAGEQS